MSEKSAKKVFVDLAKIYVKAGRGGDGMIHFRREKYVPRGGPDGGDGGKGGDIYLIGDRSLKTLLDFKYKRHYLAEDGKNGGPSQKTGRNGKNIYIRVPVGTVVYDEESGKIIGELLEHNQKLLVARGGKGGRGNARFATPENRAPRVREEGEPGEEKILRLELKLIADVGLIGFPNTGKSTLLNKIAGTSAKTAEYPFTTLTPNLGIYRDEIGPSFALVDVPGIIEGAHEGRGMGLDFLRHIERTKLLVILLDATSKNIRGDYNKLMNELKLYNENMVQKERIIAINKIDLVKDYPRLNVEEDVYYISALKGWGVDELMGGIRKCLQRINQEIQ